MIIEAMEVNGITELLENKSLLAFGRMSLQKEVKSEQCQFQKQMAL